MTLLQLIQIMPYVDRARAEAFFPYISSAMDEFSINTPKRQAAFLAQIAHESGSLRYVRELADGSAYDSRADLGNTRPEAIDIALRNNTTPGRFYRGRGLIQITGYDNYADCSQGLFGDTGTLTHNPVMLERKELAARSAAWFWRGHGLNELADAGQFKQITRRINGGYNGLAERLAYFTRAQRALVT